MKRFALAVAGAGLAAFLATPAWAQSSKFAATYDTDPVMVDAYITGAGGPASDGPNMMAEYDLASLHVAQWKEVLAGVSGQIQLVTFTQAKGKNGGGTATAIAEGTVQVEVKIVPEGAAYPCSAEYPSAYPGKVTLASRAQELSVTVDLGLVDVGECDEECIADLLDIEGDVTVALKLDTTASHHYNFVADDLASGWYDVVACYDLTALAEVAGLDIDDDTAAYAKAVLGPRILTVQEVRATKDGIVDETGTD